VTPSPENVIYVYVDDVETYLDFAASVFGAAISRRVDGPIDACIGELTVMVSSTEHRGPQTLFLYVYVDDLDGCCALAVAHGATLREAPANMPWGDCRAMFVDPCGNTYQVARRGEP
jgi:PhnB protein